METLLERLERYCDAVPRIRARPQLVGPFVLFGRSELGWSFYARPAPEATSVTVNDVAALLDHQAAAGEPQVLEWIAENTPELTAVCAEAGLVVTEHPLLVCEPGAFQPAPVPGGLRLIELGPDDDTGLAAAVADVSFRVGGTDIGPEGPELLESARRPGQPRLPAVSYAAYADLDPVAVGGHSPWDGITELTGIATLPSHRRRGIGRALTSALVADALGRGVQTIWLSATDPVVAGIYTGLGFRPVATSCSAEPAR